VSNFTGGARAVCPFYVKEAEKSITCEGLMPGTETAIRFPSSTAKRGYQQSVCEHADACKRCMLAAALDAKYRQGADNSGAAAENSVPKKWRGNVGEWLYRARTASGMTQVSLAKRAHLSRTYIGDIERGDKMPSLEALRMISETLGVPFVIGKKRKEDKQL